MTRFGANLNTVLTFLFQATFLHTLLVSFSHCTITRLWTPWHSKRQRISCVESSYRPLLAHMKLIIAPQHVSTNVMRACVLLSATTHMDMQSAWNCLQSVRCLVHHNSPVRRTSPRATQNGHQSLNGTCVALCAILAASVGGARVRFELVEFMFHQKCQAIRHDPYWRFARQSPSHLVPRHPARFLQSSPSFCEVESNQQV